MATFWRLHFSAPYRCPIYPTRCRCPAAHPQSACPSVLKADALCIALRLPMLLVRIALVLRPVLAPQPSQKCAIQHMHRGVARPSAWGSSVSCENVKSFAEALGRSWCSPRCVMCICWLAQEHRRCAGLDGIFPASLRNRMVDLVLRSIAWASLRNRLNLTRCYLWCFSSLQVHRTPPLAGKPRGGVVPFFFTTPRPSCLQTCGATVQPPGVSYFFFFHFHLLTAPFFLMYMTPPAHPFVSRRLHHTSPLRHVLRMFAPIVSPLCHASQSHLVVPRPFAMRWPCRAASSCRVSNS